MYIKDKIVYVSKSNNQEKLKRNISRSSLAILSLAVLGLSAKNLKGSIIDVASTNTDTISFVDNSYVQSTNSSVQLLNDNSVADSTDSGIITLVNLSGTEEEISRYRSRLYNNDNIYDNAFFLEGYSKGYNDATLSNQISVSNIEDSILPRIVKIAYVVKYDTLGNIIDAKYVSDKITLNELENQGFELYSILDSVQYTWWNVNDTSLTNTHTRNIIR